MSVTPTPAATRPCFDSHCSAAKLTRGSNPWARAAAASSVGCVPPPRRLDPRLVAEVAQAQARLVRERVRRGQGDEQLVVDEVDHLDVGAVEVGEVGDDGEVDLARAQAPDGVARDGLDEGELDVRVPRANAAIARGDHRRGGGLEGADPQAPAGHPRDGLDLGVGGGHAVEDRLRVPEEDPARPR